MGILNMDCGHGVQRGIWPVAYVLGFFVMPALVGRSGPPVRPVPRLAQTMSVGLLWRTPQYYAS